MSRVLLLRSRAYAIAGMASSAEDDLEQALGIVEQQRERLEEVRDRIAWFETADGIARDYVRLLVNTGRTEDALEVVERVRSRGLLDRLGSALTPGSVVSLSEAKSILGSREAVLEYWSDDDTLYIWIVRTEGTEFVRERIGRNRLAADATRFVELIEAENVDTRGTAEVLFTHLIAPAASALDGIDELTIIPDAPIADLPYSALYDRVAGSYLITQVATARAPSLTALSVMRANATAQTGGILMLGNPNTPKPLPVLNTKLEAASVRSVPGSVVYEDGDATAGALSAHAQAYHAIHLAVHTWNDQRNGPALALAPELGRADGLLYADEIEALPLRAGSLVVLAACRSSRGRQSLEGTMSLARAFAAASAGSVIASLWDATDDDSGTLFRHFYRARAAGESPTHALRTAQLMLLQNDQLGPPRRWAAYQVIGGR